MRSNNFENKMRDLDRLTSMALATPRGDDLPQVASPDEIIIEVLHNCTGKPIELLDVEVHHQTDPSYQ